MNEDDLKAYKKMLLDSLANKLSFAQLAYGQIAMREMPFISNRKSVEGKTIDVLEHLDRAIVDYRVEAVHVDDLYPGKHSSYMAPDLLKTMQEQFMERWDEMGLAQISGGVSTGNRHEDATAAYRAAYGDPYRFRPLEMNIGKSYEKPLITDKVSKYAQAVGLTEMVAVIGARGGKNASPKLPSALEAYHVGSRDINKLKSTTAAYPIRHFEVAKTIVPS